MYLLPCVSFQILSYPCIYPSVYPCFTDYVFQNFVFALTVSTDRFVWVLHNQPSKMIFLDCCMNFEYFSGSRPNRCKQNWKDFLPSSPEGIHWPLQATSTADCERSTLSLNSRVAVTQLCNAMASPKHNQHLSANSQFIRWQYESYVIVHHCLVYSIVFLCRRLFSPNRNSSRQRGKAASLRKVPNIVWGGCTWAFPRHP